MPLFLRKKVTIEKKIGETPLQALERFVEDHPRYRNIPACYAGRLDPMASGKLLILFGEECKRKDAYTKLDKEYEVEVLLGIGSDTGDILGIVSKAPIKEAARESIEEVLRKETGAHTLPYPAFSSKTVAGKPLFLYALEGTLNTISIPTHEETIYTIDLRSIAQLPQKDLKERISGLLKLAPTSDEPSKELGADFRIALVRASWDSVFSSTDTSYTVLRLKVSCGSGTYMRSLAGRIGESLGTKALALSIHRTRVG